MIEFILGFIALVGIIGLCVGLVYAIAMAGARFGFVTPYKDDYADWADWLLFGMMTFMGMIMAFMTLAMLVLVCLGLGSVLITE